jgi:hypothetical protein
MEERRMARPIYSHEVLDPDFQWLLQNYSENHPHAFVLDSTCLPIVIVLGDERSSAPRAASPPEPITQAENPGDDPVGEETER